MDKKIIKVWISKYALTQGIEEKNAVVCSNINIDMIEIVNTEKHFIGNEYYHGEGKEWHKTKEEAIKRAEELRLKKIKSVEKQLEKLKSLKFK